MERGTMMPRQRRKVSWRLRANVLNITKSGSTPIPWRHFLLAGCCCPADGVVAVAAVVVETAAESLRASTMVSFWHNEGWTCNMWKDKANARKTTDIKSVNCTVIVTIFSIAISIWPSLSLSCEKNNIDTSPARIPDTVKPR